MGKTWYRVLYGEMHVRGMDWMADAAVPAGDSSELLAQVAIDETLDSSSPPAALFPSAGGNIHQFTAVTRTAVLDVLAPPYSPGGGRHDGFSSTICHPWHSPLSDHHMQSDLILSFLA